MKKLYLAFIVALTSLAVQAQDVHYTQFYNSPLTLNPALTGVTPGAWRVGVHYRNQWFSGVNNGFFSSPYQTPSIFGDAPIYLKNKDAIGVGAMVLYDNAGAGTITTITAQVSGAYIKKLGAGGKHQISAGFQFGFTQVKLNVADAHFTSQYQGNEYNAAISSNVGLEPNRNYFGLNAGLLYYGRITQKTSVYVGGAFFNTTTPKYNLSTGQAKKDLYFRWNVEAGFDIGIGKRFHIIPSGIFMRQSSSDQLNTGLAFGYDITQRANVTLGVYNRVNDLTSNNRQVDAAILYAGFEVKGFRLGASYDFTVSKFSEAGTGTGGFELSMMYVGLGKTYDVKQILFCPRF